MKKSLLLITVLMTVLELGAQCPANGISTDPAAPVNLQLPSHTNYFFNWQNQYLNNNSTCQPLSLIESPFYKIDNLEILRASKDMKPEDGWELIKADFGYTVQNVLRPEAPQHTYFILYNKFTAVLRVLLKTCRQEDYNGVKITLKFDATSSFQTALLNFSAGTRAVGETHSFNPSVQSVSSFVNDQTKWFYADFPMAYDPCTCNYSSKINIISNLIQSSSINLEGSLNGTITSINNGQGTVTSNGSYSFKDFVNDAGEFKKVYSSVDNFITESKNVAATIPNSTAITNGLTQFQNDLKNAQFLKTGLASVPWLQSALGLFNFFSGGGTSSAQSVKIMPMAVNLSLKVNGTITTSNQYHNISLTTPGSLNAINDPDIYPYYNEVLGVFNLLQPPVFDFNLDFVQLPNFPPGQFLFFQKLKLRNPLKWTINPASKLEIQDAQVAYVATSHDNSSNPPASLSTIITPFTQVEGKDPDGYWEFRTNYINMSCLDNNHMLYFQTFANPLPVRATFLKIVLNLKRLDDPLAQNVLLILKYPITAVQTSIPFNAPVFDPALCNGGMLSQATSQDISTFCSSSVYTQNRGLRIADHIPEIPERTGTDNIVLVYPNPTSDKIYIKNTKGVKLIELYTISGSKVYSLKRPLEKIIEVSVNGLLPGTYVVKIVLENSSIIKRIIITK